MTYAKQELLVEDAPLILDTTCSFRRQWPKFASIRMDVRAVCEPDIVCDARFLPFRGGVADAIYCDPPHFVRRGDDFFVQGHERVWLKTIMLKHKLSGRVTPDEFTRYGWWKSRKEWEGFLTATTEEFARVLKVGGELHYKITHTSDRRDLHREDLDAYLAHFDLAREKVSKSRSNRKKRAPSNRVYWPVFRKK